MAELTTNFKQLVYDIVVQIPPGRLMSYGDIAALAGHPYAARVVGQIAHFGPEELPWHRVVNRHGSLASGFWGGKEVHQQLLEQENVEITDYRVKNFEELRWRPK